MLKRIACECGRSITSNTWSSHLKSKTCGLDPARKDQILYILSLKTKHRIAWLIEDAEDAKSNEQWFYSVIDGSTSLSDWAFDSPRLPGHLTPSVLRKFSIERKGSNNPMVKAHTTNYDIEEIKVFAKMMLKSIQDNDQPFRQIIAAINDQYPQCQYQLTDIRASISSKRRGHNKENAMLSYLLDIDIGTLIKMSHKMRGRSISKGQLSSDKFMKFASEHGAKLTSSLRVSRPQRILYNMILSVDSKASIEKHFVFDGCHKSYDIYSPAINAVIEMHGRVFHDLAKSKGKLLPMTQRNIKNDELKKMLAQSNGMQYLVFWDDEFHTWQDRIKEIYNKESISYADAKDKVDEANRKDACL